MTSLFNSNNTMYYQSPAPNSFIPSILKSKKTVSFKPTATVRLVEKFVSSQEDKSRLYYTQHDIREFKLEAEAIKTLSKLHSSSPGCVHAVRRSSMKSLIKLASNTDNSYEERYAALSEASSKLSKLSNRAANHFHLCTYENEDMNFHLDLAKARAKLAKWSKRVEAVKLDLKRDHEEDCMKTFHKPVGGSSFPGITKRRSVVAFPVVGTVQPTKRGRYHC